MPLQCMWETLQLCRIKKTDVNGLATGVAIQLMS